jgi:hypothetical protein
MPTTRPFAYNPTQATIAGTTNVGTLCVGVSVLDYSSNPGGLTWWMGPDEDNSYVVCKDVSTQNFPTPVGDIGNVQFWRCENNDSSFIGLVRLISGLTPVSANAASDWLSLNGYYTTYTVPSLAGSLVFNGSNQSLSLSPGLTFGTDAFTVEGWFYNNSSFTTKGILGSPVTSPDGCLNLFFSDYKTITSDRNGGGGQFNYVVSSELSLNTWHYLIYNRNHDGLTAVYVDGLRCTATSNDNLNYNTATDTVARHYGGYWPGYWTNMRITIGTAVYDSSLTTQTNPTTPLTSLANTKYLMLGAAVTTDTSGIQAVTNNNGVYRHPLKPF